MASDQGAQERAVRRNRPLNYFFINKLAHKKIHINRATDELTAWCYPTHTRVVYVYSIAKKKMEPAYTTQEVCSMLGRQLRIVQKMLAEEHIEAPQYTYGLDEDQNKYKYLWAEEDILAAHNFFSQRHKGKKRKDGLITPMHGLPTARELRAMIRQEEVLYVKKDGEFRPTWKAPDF